MPNHEAAAALKVALQTVGASAGTVGQEAATVVREAALATGDIVRQHEREIRSGSAVHVAGKPFIIVR